jgi:peptide/nickel transport system ATP-binding protein
MNTTTAPFAGHGQPSALLEVYNLDKQFRVAGSRRTVRALHQVSFAVDRGQAVALVGESGSGKSTIGRIVLRLERRDGGEVRFRGRPVHDREPRRNLQAYRRRVQMIFQDPFASLNDVNSVHYHLERPLLRHGKTTRAGARQAILQLLSDVGLEPAEDFLDKFPHELSGGQRQRVAIARALAPEPELIVADEPTSMLDVSIRMGVLNLLARLKRTRNLALLFITHDLGSARYLADRVVVLYGGQIMEMGPTAAVVDRPAHPYTRLLLSATPRSSGTAPAPLPIRASSAGARQHETTGCPFASRCPEATAVCVQQAPAPVHIGAGHQLRCHLVNIA